ncbi:ScyD/ScyE family protein [Nocardioides sp. LHG3406-4]|uniref:ScyD/ScyE family protein n=1 Tax=Nocardioides sp. LHG3406-4 TaxID=2804575 RepID=UPI003CE6F2C8
MHKRMVFFAAAALLLSSSLSGAVATSTANAAHPRGPTVTHLAAYGTDDFTVGSTIGPDGALYVTEGSAGEVLRIDRRTGAIDTFASGLPPKPFPGLDIGGAVDVAFLHGRAYVLTTLLHYTIVPTGEQFGDPGAKNGLYRIEPDGTPKLIADLGQWSVDNPPNVGYFVDTGVQFAMQPYRGGFLVTDGHHNRVLWVSKAGAIAEVATFGNVVPTGLETAAGDVFVSQLGPIPHLPETGKIVAGDPRTAPHEVASGASMLIDVERGPRGVLYALSQGQWDGVGEGSRALPNTGRLLVVGRNGDLTAVIGANGQELVLDRPTSVEFVGRTAFVVSVTGDVYRINHL